MDAIVERPASLRKQVGEQLRRLRKHRGLTLKQLADAVGTSPQTVSRLETDDMTLSVDWIERISSALQIKPFELFADGSLVEAIDARIEAEARLFTLQCAFNAFIEAYSKELGR